MYGTANIRAAISHENLPQILGYSDGKTPTPFILMAPGNLPLHLLLYPLTRMLNAQQYLVKINDVHAYVQTALKTQTLASSASTMLRMVNFISELYSHCSSPHLQYRDITVREKSLKLLKPDWICHPLVGGSTPETTAFAE